MIKNYIKLAWKVLKRNKLFTFISLFGISFTLTILLVGATFLDDFAQSNYPAYNQSRITYIIYVRAWNEKLDNGEYGRAYQISPSYYFLNNYVSTLNTPLNISLYSPRSPKTVNGLIKERPVKVEIKYTDVEFWNILNFKFLNGRPYNKKELDEAQQLCVISQSLANEHFDNPQSAVGQFIEADKLTYQIIGVVKDVPQFSIGAYSRVWAPLTTLKTDFTDRTLAGNMTAMMLVNKKSDLAKLENELQQSLKKIEYPVGEIQRIETRLTTAKDVLFNNEFAPVHGPVMYSIFTMLILTIILIPSFNLTTINSTRIRERLSEIGIRKSFGASKGTLLFQFLIENLILTLLGGLIAFILTIIILKVIQSTGIITVMAFPINIRIFLTGLGLCFIFSFISGVLPAYRMSRLQIVESLNEKGL